MADNRAAARPDHVPTHRLPSLHGGVDDVRVVMDAAKSRQTDNFMVAAPPVPAAYGRILDGLPAG